MPTEARTRDDTTEDSVDLDMILVDGSKLGVKAELGA